MNVKPSVVLGVSAAGLAGWVGFRLYVRSEVEKYFKTKTALPTESSGAFLQDLVGIAKATVKTRANLPSAAELAESMVPIFSTVMPEKAWDDIQARGRDSRYWPAAYRATPTGMDRSIETQLFALVGPK
tara:strand:+ start:836 stop:1222 length:387 start_codon:yes stop_codon:yes gene_type:complete